MKLSRFFICLILCATIFRLGIILLNLQLPQNPDVQRYKEWAEISYKYGFSNTYTKNHIAFGVFENNQPPGSVYILTLAYVTGLFVKDTIYPFFSHDTTTFFFLRLPALLGDVGIGTLIYLFIRRYSSEKYALTGSTIFLFTPAIWYNSAVWGQMDSVNNFFFVLALYLLYTKRRLLSTLSYTSSCFIKLSLLPVLPIIVLLIVKKVSSLTKAFFYAASALCFLFIATVPVSLNPFWLITYFLKYSGGEMQNITCFAFNFWWVVLMPGVVESTVYSQQQSLGYGDLTGSPHKLSPLLLFDLSTWGYILFALFLFPLLYILIKEKKEHMQLEVNVIATCLLLTFMFLPGMHDRYLYPVVPVLALLAGYGKKYIYLLLFFSISNFLNIYIVWHLPEFTFLPKDIIYNQTLQWFLSVLVLGGGILWYIDTIKPYVKKYFLFYKA